VAKKAKESRFHIHDELTAPERSAPVLKGALSTGGQVSNMLGVLAGAPAVLRAYARFRSELRHGHLELATIERIALAVAAHHDAKASLDLHSRTARSAGLGLDEMALARKWDSYDPSQAVLLQYLEALVKTGKPPTRLHEQAREGGWSDEELLEAIAVVALETFTALVNVAGDVPGDGSPEVSRRLEAA
jgi:alkylhydroperoxidase family enzyme